VILNYEKNSVTANILTNHLSVVALNGLTFMLALLPEKYIWLIKYSYAAGGFI